MDSKYFVLNTRPVSLASSLDVSEMAFFVPAVADPCLPNATKPAFPVIGHIPVSCELSEKLEAELA